MIIYPCSSAPKSWYGDCHDHPSSLEACSNKSEMFGRTAEDSESFLADPIRRLFHGSMYVSEKALNRAGA